MSSLIQPGPIQDIRRRFLRANDTFDQYAAVYEAIGERLRARLDLLAIEPKRVLDLGCRSGYQLEALQQRYPQAEIIGVDPAPGKPTTLPSSWPAWLRRQPKAVQRIACDPHELPFADGSFDLVVSNLLLPWCHSPHLVFSEVARLLRPEGAFMFTSAGPDTLLEYRSAWATIDSYLHGFGLLDMHDIGDTMMASGFAAPVLDRDTVQVDYPDIEALQHELRSVGASNAASGRRLGLMSRSVTRSLSNTVGDAERFVVTLELVQGHGWKGELRPPGKNTDEGYTVPADTLKGSWKGKLHGR